MRISYIREKVTVGHVLFEHVTSQQNVADILTKPLTFDKQMVNMDLLGMSDTYGVSSLEKVKTLKKKTPKVAFNNPTIIAKLSLDNLEDQADSVTISDAEFRRRMLDVGGSKPKRRVQSRNSLTGTKTGSSQWFSL